MTTKLYAGSEGVVTRIYGYEEAVAAQAASTPAPAPAPAPAPSSNILPVTLVAGTTVSAPAVTEGQTMLALAVDTSVLDATACAAVGVSFKVLLQVPVGLLNPIAFGLKVNANVTTTYPLQPSWNSLLIEVTCVAAGAVVVTKITNG
jgi:hypothetical protein